MNTPEWTPVYLTETERADIAARLIMHGEDANRPEERTRCLELAGIFVFGTSAETRAA
jgi:hypothetical protein